MKPVYLELCGFGPYEEKTAIPFERLSRHGIFLISGDTGAGKTTIFDGICYALFGEASGAYRSGDSLRSDFMPEEGETYVYLEFFLKEKRYALRRSPQYRRGKKRGKEGYTLERAQACLWEPEKEPVTGFGAVTRRIEELLGLSLRQFKQIFMIAQGEFQQVLLADSASRGEIFRKVFDTEQYQKLQEGLKEYYLSVKREYDSCKEQTEGILSQLSFPRGDILSEEQSRCMENIFRLPEFLRALSLWEKAQKEQYEKKEVWIAGLEKEELERKVQISRWEDKKEKVKKAEDASKRAEEEYQKALLRKEREGERLELCLEKTGQKESLDREIFLIEKQLPQYEQWEIQKREQEVLSERLRQEEEKMERLSALEECAERLEEGKTRVEEYEEWEKGFRRFLDGEEKAGKQGKLWRKALLQKEREEEEYRKLEQAYFNGQAGVLAGRLEEGKPCPVCGSLVHPSPAPKEENVPAEEQVQEKKRQLELLDKKAGKEQEQFLIEKAAYEEAKNNLTRLISRYPQLSEVSPKEGERLFSEKRKEQEQKLLIWEEKLKQAEGEEREILFSKRGKEIMGERRLQIEQYRLSVKKQEGILAEKRKGLIYGTLKEAKEALEKKKEKKAVLEKEEQISRAQYQLQEQEVLRREISLKEKKAALEKEREELKQIVEATGERKAGEKQETLEREKEEQKKWFHILKLNGQLKGQLALLQQKMEALEEQCQRAKLLSNTASGELSGRQKIPFEQYVQSFYLDQVLLEANKRLFSMTLGRYELVRQKEASDKKTKAGLEVDVMDYYSGKERSVKTLSGGECFKAALCMALGFSDVVQSYAGGIQADALFIDEGFGSLDSASLEQALSVLQNLSDGRKMVGIISHVPELKERIESRLEVCRERGQSHVLLVDGSR